MGRGRKETCWLKETAPTYLAGGCGGAWQQRLELEVHSSRSKSSSRCLSKIARLKNDRIFPEGADGLLEAAPGTRPFSSLPSGLVVFAKHASSSSIIARRRLSLPFFRHTSLSDHRLYGV